MTGLAYFTRDETGAAAAEYALILAFIAIAIVVGLTALGASLRAVFANVAIAAALTSS